MRKPIDGRAVGKPGPPASARLSTGVRLHDHDQQHRHGRAGGDGGLPLPLARARALSDLARNGPHHRARHPRSPGGADRAHPGRRGLGGKARARCRRARRRLSRSSALRPSRSRPPRRAATRPWAGADPARACASASWPDPDLYADSADHNLLVVAIVEEESALAHADEIAATPGVDVVFAGTGDLSFSLGLRGDQRHPLVQESAALILAAARRHRKVAGRPAGSFEETQRYIEQGFLFFQAPSDLALFETGAQQFLGPHGVRPLRRQHTLY